MIHVVKEGDTLYGLSQMYHVGVEEIMYRNPYANLYHLQAGDELCIPVGKSGNHREPQALPQGKETWICEIPVGKSERFYKNGGPR